MLLSTQTSVLSSRFGDRDAIRIINEAGFDAYDYSFGRDESCDHILKDDYREYFNQLRKYADSIGIVCNQAHAHYPVAIYGKDEWNNSRYNAVIRDIEAASVLGAKTIVVHPIHCGYPGEGAFERNMKFYEGLMPYCEKFGIKVALENMWKNDPKRGFIVADVCSGAENFIKYIDGLDNRYFTACLDLGHCGLVGEEAHDAIRILGKRIGALHVHDNDYLHDSHTMPYMGKMEWDEILKALADAEYEGDFTYEADSFLRGFPDRLIKPGLELMAKVGRDMIAEIKKQRV